MNGLALLILAGIAAFFFFQIRSVLGQVPDDYQKNQASKKGNLKEVIIDHEATPLQSTENFDKKFLVGSETEQDELIEQLKKLQADYREFSLGKFIDGAKSAYNMILDAFTKDKLKDIKPFVSTEIYDSFSKLRASYNEKKYEYINVITHIESAMIKNVVLTSSTAYITVEINSKNVTALKDSLGNILQGNPETIRSVKDIWEFKREFSETSPAWTLISMSE